MITFSKFKSQIIANKKRIVTVLQFGAKTAKEVNPFGFDSCAIENLTAIYSETSNEQEAVILGYVNENAISGPGETRIYAKDLEGIEKGFIYLRCNGTIEVNGSQYTAVRFSELQTSLNVQKDLINIELQKISLALATLGVVYTVAPVQVNISSAESPTIKLK